MRCADTLRRTGWCCALGWFVGGSGEAWAQEAATQAANAAAPAIDTGNNAWMLVASALVLMMTGPGLALFYSGLVRKKNVLSVMMQCVFLMAMMSVIWALWGYSLSFGGDNPWLGDLSHLFLKGVQPVAGSNGPEIPVYEPTKIPLLTHMLFQGMFFVITPALICGAFAERMKFSAMALFMALWGTLVYCPLCHWVWDAGVLSSALDYAGGTVVHISSGVSALVCALLVGKRLGVGSEPMPPHNMTYTAIGATMLWVGWFGFNAGSALAADGLAANAFAVTHLGAAGGAVAWAAMEWTSRGKPTLLGTCSGAVAGLVCVTPAAGFVMPMSGIVMGAAAGVVCYYSCTALKSRFRYDDSLDAFGVHGVGGTLGAVLTGVFATRAAGTPDPVGLLEGGSRIVPQITAVAITWGLAAVATFVLLKIVDATVGLRVSQSEEIQGLDMSEHGEEGYIFI